MSTGLLSFYLRSRVMVKLLRLLRGDTSNDKSQPKFLTHWYEHMHNLQNRGAPPTNVYNFIYFDPFLSRKRYGFGCSPYFCFQKNTLSCFSFYLENSRCFKIISINLKPLKSAQCSRLEKKWYFPKCFPGIFISQVWIPGIESGIVR